MTRDGAPWSARSAMVALTDRGFQHYSWRTCTHGAVAETKKVNLQVEPAVRGTDDRRRDQPRAEDSAAAADPSGSGARGET